MLNNTHMDKLTNIIHAMAIAAVLNKDNDHDKNTCEDVHLDLWTGR